jgi:hypothetical protein
MTPRAVPLSHTPPDLLKARLSHPRLSGCLPNKLSSPIIQIQATVQAVIQASIQATIQAIVGAAASSVSQSPEAHSSAPDSCSPVLDGRGFDLDHPRPISRHWRTIAMVCRTGAVGSPYPCHEGEVVWASGVNTRNNLQHQPYPDVSPSAYSSGTPVDLALLIGSVPATASLSNATSRHKRGLP